MPIREQWVEPTLLVERSDVRVVWAYKYDREDEPLSYHYNVIRAGQPEQGADQFDVRELPGFDQARQDDRAHHVEVVAAAIAAGTLQAALYPHTP